jgi:TolA-binding protein
MFYKAETKRYSGADTEALRIYEEFVEKYPGNDFSSKAHFNSGIIYYNRKYYALANKSLLLSVASVDPSLRARAYTLLGEIALQENRYEAALQYFETAQKVERVPDDLVNRALFGLAAASFYLSDYDRTIPLLESVEKNDGSFEPNKVAFYIAEASFRKGEYERAYSYYEQIPSSDPLLGPSVQYGKAYCNYNLQQYERAVYAFKDFMQTYPDDRRITDAKVRLADSYFAVKDFALAAQMYEELLKDKTTEGRDYVMYQHALALQNTGRSNNAIDQLQKLVKNYPASKYTENSRYLIGWIHFQQYNFYDAIEGYKNALPKIKTEAMRPLIYYSLGDCYYNLAEYDSALAYYNRITGSYPSSPYVFDAVNGMQLCYQAQGDYDMAVEVIDNYVSSNPNAPFSDKLFLKQGELYYGIGEYEKARESYTEFLQRYTQSEFVPDAHYWLGKSASMLGMEEEAITHYKIVLHNYPNNLLAADAVVEIGSIHIEAERYEAAAEIFDQAILRLKESPRLPELYYLKGIAMKHMDEKGSAYDLFDHVATYNGDNIYADKSRLELGILEMDARRYDKALELFKQLFSKRSDDIGAAAQYYHGLTHFKQNNYNDAITSFVRVPNLYGAYEEWVAKAMLNMGLCYERKNDFDEAASIYRNVFRKHRGDEFGDEAKLRLENIEQ